MEGGGQVGLQRQVILRLHIALFERLILVRKAVLSVRESVLLGRIIELRRVLHHVRGLDTRSAVQVVHWLSCEARLGVVSRHGSPVQHSIRYEHLALESQRGLDLLEQLGRQSCLRKE